VTDDEIVRLGAVMYWCEGCLVIDVARSRDLYRMVEGTVRGLAGTI
jgi:hypothetical protein